MDLVAQKSERQKRTDPSRTVRALRAIAPTWCFIMRSATLLFNPRPSLIFLTYTRMTGYML